MFHLGDENRFSPLDCCLVRCHKMAASLVFLLLSPLVTCKELESVDKACEGETQCLHRSECETFTQGFAEYKKLPRNSCQQKEALAELKGSVCNKKESGVCCKLCGLGQVCTPQEDCPSFKAQKNNFKKYRKGTPEYNKFLESIKKRICDKDKKTVCCERKDSKCRAPQNLDVKLSSQPLSNSCNPENGSCLPEVGRCGQAGGEQRIVGGEETLPGEFPFTALLGKKGKKKAGQYTWEVKVFTCGGTLINLRYVLTAAHCHHPTIRRRQISLVRLGEYEVTEHNEPDCIGEDFCLEQPQDFDIAPDDVVLHPEYGKERQSGVVENTINDIALIRLPKSASENMAVRVACLPIHPKVAAAQLNVPDIGDGLTSFYPTVVGWGHTQGDPLNRTFSGSRTRVASSSQQRLAVPVLSSEKCAEKLFDFIPRLDQICAGGESGKDSCSVSFQSNNFESETVWYSQGDSGGPLYMRYIIEGQNKSAYFDNSRPWYLLGVVSFGTRICGAGSPAVYTRWPNV